MRYLPALLLAALLGSGLFYLLQLPDHQEAITLETRFPPDRILRKNPQLAEKQIEKSRLRYAPYLLIESMYRNEKKKTQQGTSLWSLVDGEMVLNADRWEKSDCFQNALEAGAKEVRTGLVPCTKTSRWLTTRSYNHLQKIPERYSKEELLQIAGIAFGEGFTVLSSKEVLLPVVEIEILSSEGVVESRFWNGFNGEPLLLPY